MPNESARLVLRTYDISNSIPIPASENNTIGTISSNNGYLMWKNINLKDVLGDMFDKYNTFEISLIGFNKNAGGTTIFVNNRVATFLLSGFDWVDNNFNIRRKSLTKQAQMALSGFIDPIANNGYAVLRYNKNGLAFRKDKQMIDIELEMIFSNNNTVNGLQEKPTNVLGHMTFIFQITPLI